VLFNLSYYFDYDIPQRERPDIAVLAVALEKWQGASDSELVAIDRDDELTVIDLRSISVEQMRVFTGLERAILLACDEIRSRDGIRRAVIQDLGPNAADEISSALDRLQAAHLMLSEGDTLLSLPVLLGPYSAPRPIVKLLMALMPPAARAS